MLNTAYNIEKINNNLLKNKNQYFTVILNTTTNISYYYIEATQKINAGYQSTVKLSTA